MLFLLHCLSDIISYLTYQSSNFKTSEKWKFSRFKDFRRFRAFALYYESAESAESSENVVLLPDKWIELNWAELNGIELSLDYFLTVLKLVPNVQDSRKLNKASFLLEK